MSIVIDLNKTGTMSCESTGIAEYTVIDEKNKIIQPRAMELNKISRNRSQYPSEDIIRGLKADHINEGLRTQTWHSELEHPEKGCSQERFLTVNPHNTCGSILAWWLDGDNIMLKYKIIEPVGYIIWDWIMGGTNMAFSIRAYTPNFVEKVNEKGEKYVLKHGNMFIVTFDAVKTPGFKGARIADIDKYDATQLDIAKNDRMRTNSREGSNLVIWDQEISQEEFEHFVKTCENFNILKDLFGLEDNKIDVIYRNDNKVVVNNRENTSEQLILGIDTYELMKTLTTKKHF